MIAKGDLFWIWTSLKTGEKLVSKSEYIDPLARKLECTHTLASICTIQLNISLYYAHELQPEVGYVLNSL